MVTSYYIMKMAKSQININTDEYFTNIYNTPISKEMIKENSKCRVCLKDGAVSIFDVENTYDITEALKLLANIELNEIDTFPKYLCDTCYIFIKSAVMFRKVANKTNELLKEQLKSNLISNDWDEPFSEVKTSQNPSNNEKEFDLFSNTLKDKIDKRDSKIQCQTCNKIVRKSYYKTHMTMHDPNHQKYICDICGKTFRLRVGYHNHKLRHTNDYPYKCDLCPFQGRYAERLKSHMRTHSGEYKYTCTECPARFLFKGNFNSHILLKHKKPEYKCNNCDKAYHTKLKLQMHHEVDHLGIKSHICNICGRAFGYRNAMMKHQRRVHKREKLRFTYNTTPQIDSTKIIN